MKSFYSENQSVINSQSGIMQRHAQRYTFYHQFVLIIIVYEGKNSTISRAQNFKKKITLIKFHIHAIWVGMW